MSNLKKPKFKNESDIINRATNFRWFLTHNFRDSDFDDYVQNENQRRDPAFCDFEEMEDTLVKYFTECEEIGKPPVVSGLCLVLGVSRNTVWEYSVNKRTDKNFHPRAVKLIQNAKKLCENWIETNMLMGKANAVASIFSLKNHYGWVDQQHIDTTTNGESITKQAIQINMPEIPKIKEKQSVIDDEYKLLAKQDKESEQKLKS